MAKIPNLKIFGGSFEDLEGSLINKGYLLFELSHDAEYATGPNQVVGGIRRRINLDASGNVPTNPAVIVYSNDVLLPSGTFYIVRCFKADGTEAWASPQNWVFAASPNPLDLGTVVPTNPPGSGTTGGLTLLLETNGTANGSQSLLNLKQGSNITLTDNGSGQVTIAGTTSPISLKTNNTANGSQTLLNLQQGSNVTLTDNGSGQVTVAATVPTTWPLPNTSRVILHTPGGSFPNAGALEDTFFGDSSLATGSGAGITGGTVSSNNATATIGPTWNIVGTGSGVDTGFVSVGSATGVVYGGRSFIFQSAGSVTNTDTGGRGMIGLAKTTLLNTGAALPTTIDFAMFVYDPFASSNWLCETCDETAITVADSGIVANSTPHYFEIDFTPATSAVFKIDGNPVATIITHLPLSTSLLKLFFMINTLSTTTNGINCAYLYAQQPLF